MIKRTIDLAAAGLGLALLGPLMLAAAGAVLITLGPPVLFRQRRAGLRGRPFTLLKLRTMRIAQDAGGRPLPDEERLTPLGRLLRRTSVDELPQLGNVLVGEMSLVGPRPLLPEYVGRYTPQQARRLEVKPGITGWAQVSGRNALSWQDRLALDVWYVDHASLALDLGILLRTLVMVVSGRGIARAGHATMPEFLGAGDDR